MNIKKMALALAVSAGVSSSVVMAATNPTAPSDTTSTGEFRISLFNGTKIKLYGLQDIELKQVGDTVVTNTSGSTPVCVASNVDNYDIALSSSNNFQLVSTSDAVNKIDFSLAFVTDTGNAGSTTLGTWDSSNLASGQYLNQGVSVTEKIATGINSAACTGTAGIVATLDADTIVNPGAYSDTITVTVSPI